MVSVQLSSVTQSCPALCDPMDCSMPGFPVHYQLPEPTKTYVHWFSDVIQPSHSLSSPSPPTFNLSQHQGLLKISQCFASGGQSIGAIASAWVLPGLISFRIDWFDLAMQRTLKSLLQHHNSKASILQHSTFFITQLSHLYMATGKTIALTRWVFVSKVISLLFNMLSRLVIAFLPRSKRLLIS